MSGGPERLLSPITLRGGLTLANRVVMAPMTRARAGAGDVPPVTASAYYAQRASSGLIITEGVNISLEGKGYSQTPGIFTTDQVQAWSEVVDAVHLAGGLIFCQLWHVGRISHPDVSGFVPVAPVAQKPPRAKVWIHRPDGWEGLIEVGEPRAMSLEDISRTVDDYAAAATNAMAAGFDGVEIHGANGYLVDQFLRSTTNSRSDAYGGSVDARLRFLLEVTDAVVAAVGSARTGVRLSPFVEYGDTNDPEIEETMTAAAAALDDRAIAYLHFAQLENQHLHRARSDGSLLMNESLKRAVRERFHGPLMLAGEFTAESAEAALGSGSADLVAFGRSYIANPDLVERFRDSAEIAQSDRSTWYGGGAVGYIDYPALHAHARGA